MKSILYHHNKLQLMSQNYLTISKIFSNNNNYFGNKIRIKFIKTKGSKFQILIYIILKI